MDTTHTNTHTDEFKLPFGLRMARKAFRKDKHRKKVSACYIEGNTILIDSNCNKTDPAAKALNYRMSHRHAEFNLLKNVEDASKGTLYIYREKMDGSFGMARCCPQCMEFIKTKGVRKIVYTTDMGIATEKIIY